MAVDKLVRLRVRQGEGTGENRLGENRETVGWGEPFASQSRPFA